jgi:recombination protein RecT
VSNNLPTEKKPQQPPQQQVTMSSFFNSEQMKSQIKAALPPHIDVDRFIRILITALSQNSKLAQCDRNSLIVAAMKCAQDGLLPDGREAALVPFWNNKQKVNLVQYMPMFEGILKKIRNSGEVLSIEAHVVHESDMFTYRPGIDEIPLFNPDWFGDRGEIKGAYAVAKTKDGGLYVEVMSMKQIDSVKKVSRSSGEDYSPWNGDFRDEMIKKSVIRRLSKRLPKSTDLEQVLKNDDENYELPDASNNANQIASPEAKQQIAAPASASTKQSRAEKAMGIKKPTAEVKDPDPVEPQQEPQQEQDQDIDDSPI